MVFKKIKEGFGKVFGGSASEDPGYVEIDLGELEKKSKVVVKPFVLKQFDDINPILTALREGYTIAIVDIRPLKSKDIIELKRAISKIKKTAEAIEGSIAGFGENIIIATPSFAEISRGEAKSPIDKLDKLE